MDEFTFDTDIFAEINDSQAEIFDVIEEEKFDVEKYINGETDYWYKLTNVPLTFFNASQNHNSPWKILSFHIKGERNHPTTEWVSPRKWWSFIERNGTNFRVERVKLCQLLLR